MKRDVNPTCSRSITHKKAKSKVVRLIFPWMGCLELKRGRDSIFVVTKLLFSATCDPQTDRQIKIINRALAHLFRAIINKNCKILEECCGKVPFEDLSSN